MNHHVPDTIEVVVTGRKWPVTTGQWSDEFVLWIIRRGLASAITDVGAGKADKAERHQSKFEQLCAGELPSRGGPAGDPIETEARALVVKQAVVKGWFKNQAEALEAVKAHDDVRAFLASRDVEAAAIDAVYARATEIVATKTESLF